MERKYFSCFIGFAGDQIFGGVIEKGSNVVDECLETEVDATGWCDGLAVNGISWWIQENDSFEEGDVGFCFGEMFRGE